MNLCRTWIEEEFLVGKIYPIAQAQFLYNNTVVGIGTVTAKLSFDELTNTYALELTITDNTTNTYTYNAIMIVDSNNVNVALFTYAKAYSKGTGQLTVKETIYIPQPVAVVNFATYGLTVKSLGEMIGNALMNGGTIYLPNYIFFFDASLVLIDQVQFTPSINITPTEVQEYQTISCPVCILTPEVTAVLVYFDSSSMTVIIYGVYPILLGFVTANVQWSIPFNPNC
ncbi:conserved hypothetical protein [Betalipothrixvirus acidiani]|uniref:Uncharacterized protein n=1 Tax=Betalipothrixvirus acidiani TaxID=346881 RepID=A7WKD8_9VIRU|nr:hypothetical protein AFV3_gp49 [Acidianus filamentous virus 3]CAJ31539.1 conserved hypothetical protein [Acidianus filamentous virus 3]